MLKIEMALIGIFLLLLDPTPAVADVGSELARCELEAQRLFPAPPNKGARNWADRAANLQKRAENIETCMRTAGYRVTAECSVSAKSHPRQVHNYSNDEANYDVRTNLISREFWRPNPE
jgi:hypothetical protein